MSIFAPHGTHSFDGINHMLRISFKDSVKKKPRSLLNFAAPRAPLASPNKKLLQSKFFLLFHTKIIDMRSNIGGEK
jgi:hypothetical protein